MKTKNEQHRALENDYPEKSLDPFRRLEFCFALLRSRFLGNLFVKTKDEQLRVLENDYPEKVLDPFRRLEFCFALLRRRFLES